MSHSSLVFLFCPSPLSSPSFLSVCCCYCCCCYCCCCCCSSYSFPSFLLSSVIVCAVGSSAVDPDVINAGLGVNPSRGGCGICTNTKAAETFAVFSRISSSESFVHCNERESCSV